MVLFPSLVYKKASETRLASESELENMELARCEYRLVGCFDFSLSTSHTYRGEVAVHGRWAYGMMNQSPGTTHCGLRSISNIGCNT